MVRVCIPLAFIPPAKSSQRNVPRNLLDDLPDKRSLLAEMSLGSADSGLGNSGRGFLHGEKKY
jgi:hypothetical protein